MEAFLVSTFVVAIAEIGDKTQLLALILAARFRRPWPIVLGILVATIANHFAAGALGAAVASLFGPELLRRALGISFLAVAVWALIPDRMDEDEPVPASAHGAFIATTVAFFLAEIGDKTQIATVALAARFDALAWVVAGTTIGMMLANVPAVLLGHRLGRAAFALGWVRYVAAATFALLGLAALFDVNLDPSGWFGHTPG
ncbi:TMEM165/GDT1 family protein [Plasticicumulans sp.]|uniref:TMEM165/GDT1 family protein n=1 Tax=Plasticicumulans sp. TaxID=2307179 RepID=UPI002BBA98B1|nr:TMEM165/GDT1 family protein [Plasticicumulans sp.]HMW43336.1 TMEM165/GDT1 family protein [Plasticicumulans sp.]HND99344.1 TMEM165/GDT1 family protein [Plasticicumulans sp.]HNF66419.1 TMEM165/GDT1 family protein [Plasticicumulans sp.]HNG51041.1 TMEM165/GDT1 family protein [Plasticicumulans sp.]HNI23840.1 TMEM165/GDT1 family protein [Plasticicumulans sp.]